MIILCISDQTCNTMVKYFITSGNSKTGNATIRALKALGENDIVAGARYFNFFLYFIFVFSNSKHISVLSRDPIKSAKKLKEDGASEVVEFDFTKPCIMHFL